jgi:hypothetical protein
MNIQLKSKKCLMALAMALACQMPALAGGRALQVWQTDGQKVTISLNEEPRTTYSEGNLIITTTKTTITYPLEQVRKFTYILEGSISEGDGVPDGIKAILSDDSETLSFKGLKSNAEIQLYSAAGQLIRTFKPKSDKVAVSISQFPTGVYIVKANGVTYKITKR